MITTHRLENAQPLNLRALGCVSDTQPAQKFGPGKLRAVGCMSGTQPAQIACGVRRGAIA